MMNDPRLRREVYVGVIISVLVMFFVEPLLRSASSIVVWAGANIYEGISNSIYREAALGFREKFSFITLAFGISLLTGIMTGTAFAMFGKHDATAEAKRSCTKKYLAGALAFAIFLQSLYVVGTNFADLQLNASFNQRIAALAPKVSDQQIKELRAKWALMERRGDYSVIVSEMDRLAVSVSAKLPKPLWE